jgi:hypothetical protein
MKAKLALSALLMCVSSLVVGQAQVIDAGDAADITTLTAKIEAVDQANRTVTVKGKMGRVVTLKVGPNVKNFAQVKVGDDIVLKYSEALSIKLEKGAADRGASYVSTGPVGAPAGAKPGVAAAQQTVIVATVQGKDPMRGEVLLQGPQGGFAEVKVKDSNVFNDVQVGDNVKVTYTEALVIDVVTPAAAKK